MAETPLTPEQIRADKLAQIERINRHLASGLTESREEDEQAKWSLAEMRQRRDELLNEIGGSDAAGPGATARVRQVRMVGSKGY